MIYRRRIVDTILADYLSAIGAVLITGPKWCGKTTTAAQAAQSILKLDDPGKRQAYLTTAQVNPSALLKGETPRLIDEWQLAPSLWDAVRNEVDSKSPEKGLFILTGSTTVKEDSLTHSGAGRIARLTMHPMSLFESGESNGTIPLKSLFDEDPAFVDGCTSSLSIEGLIQAACRGGWPDSVISANATQAGILTASYIDAICNSDASTVDGVRRLPERVRAVLRSYAKNIATLATDTVILGDVAATFGDISMPTLVSYLDALRKLYVIMDLPGWNPRIRSKTAMRSGPKRMFTDPSVAVSLLGLSPGSLMTDLNTFGFLFECLCVRDIRVYATALGATLSYYHDKTGLEADAVLHLSDGRYALIEFKLGGSQIDEGAKHLLKIQSLIKAANSEKKTEMPLPSFLGVITGGTAAYCRPDSVLVLPIGCLRD